MSRATSTVLTNLCLVEDPTYNAYYTVQSLHGRRS